MNSLSLRDGLLIVMVMAIWGANFAVTKTAVEDTPPLFLVGVRFLMVAVLLVPFVKIPWGRMKQLIGLSVTLGLLHFALMFNGIARVDAAVAAIAVQVQAPFAAILAWVVFRERVGWRRIGGMVLAFSGVLLIAGEPGTVTELGALVMIVAASFMWCVSAIQMKTMGKITVFQLNGWMAVFAVPQLFIASALIEGTGLSTWQEVNWVGWASSAYMAVFVVIVGYGLWATFLRTYPVNQVMPFSLLGPVFGMLSGIVFLGEAATLERLIGAVIVLAGVAAIVIDPKLYMAYLRREKG
ncbi:MAG: EamA family transporter [Alphaproteobacteria bacterium]|nr:EamA family transporter [Alphaproteobacteria bacterium]